MTNDEMRGHIADVLALPLSDSQTTAALLSRVNGAEPEQLRELAESEKAREQAEIDLTTCATSSKNRR